MRILTIIKKFITGGTLGVLIVGAFYVGAGHLGYVPKVHPFVVMSGSMEPAIPVGSVVISQPQPTYVVGDAITFRTGKGDETVTHRIAKIEPAQDGVSYTTHGDANEQLDVKAVAKADVVGKVTLSAPYLGYVVSFAKQPYGFIAMVIVPATIVVYEELKTLWYELIKLIRKLSGRGATDVTIDVVAKIVDEPAALTETASFLPNESAEVVLAANVESVSAKDELTSEYSLLAPVPPQTTASHKYAALSLALPEISIKRPKPEATTVTEKRLVTKPEGSRRLWLPLLPVLGSLTVFVMYSNSFFSDVEASFGSVLSASDNFASPLAAQTFRLQEPPVSSPAGELEDVPKTPDLTPSPEATESGDLDT